MIFAVCNPAIASEAQIGLALRILCGFGIDEIAEAFLSIKKRSIKDCSGRKKSCVPRTSGWSCRRRMRSAAGWIMCCILFICCSVKGIIPRHRTRYCGSELCFEALRLGMMLIEYERTNLPKTNALMALMCFHASRFNARQTNEGEVVLYEQQDPALWDTALINQGVRFLSLFGSGE